MNRPRSALVIGAGLAGSAIAAVLARRGWRVTVLAAQGHAPPASAVPAAVMAPPVGPARDPLSRIRRRGVACTRAWLAHLERAGFDAGRVADGVVIHPAGERARARHERIGPDHPHARPSAPGSTVLCHALGACVRPTDFAEALRASAHGLATIDAHVAGITRDGDQWSARDEAGRAVAHGECLVVAAGAASGHLLPEARHLLHPARGQATAFAADPRIDDGALPVSGGGYITPAVDGCHWVGATLQRGDTDLQPRRADDAANLVFARERLGMAAAPDAAGRFVGIRATTPNRIPLVGACTGGAWMSAGHGAHGLLTACLSAHLIADALVGRDHPWLRLTAPLRRRDRGGE